MDNTSPSLADKETGNPRRRVGSLLQTTCLSNNEQGYNPVLSAVEV